MSRFHRAPHQIFRYGRALRLLRELGPRASVLEVGSGVEGVGTWWPHRFVGVDLDFAERRAPGLRPIRADATRLPFPDGTFDAVLCIAVLPWLRGSRREALGEAVRVSRRAILVVNPCGEEARDSDRRNIEWCSRHGIDPPGWLVAQVEQGLPRPKDIRAALDGHGRVSEGMTVSVPAHDRLFRREQRLRRVPGAMTGLQPLIRAWGKWRRPGPAGPGSPYERWFLLDKSATASPPRRRS